MHILFFFYSCMKLVLHVSIPIDADSVFTCVCVCVCVCASRVKKQTPQVNFVLSQRHFTQEQAGIPSDEQLKATNQLVHFKASLPNWIPIEPFTTGS